MKTVENKEKKLLYEKTYPVKYYEMDFNRILKPSALMNFLQDTATQNAEMLGFGPSFVFPNNYAWFLLKYRMEFDDYPHNLDDIVIQTEPRGGAKILAHRDFWLFTAEGKKLGRVASTWALVDLKTKNMLHILKTAPVMLEFKKRENDLQYEKIKSPEKIEFEKIFEIRFDDIDVNHHVNNANYIVWAFETLPYGFKSQHKLNTLDAAYKKEVAFGHKILSLAQIIEESGQKISLHCVKNATTNEELCLIKAVWK